MTKIIERDSVPEKKSANLMIAIYAVILLAKILEMVNSYVITYVKSDLFQTFSNFVDMAYKILIIAIFSYGVIQALRKILSPQRMGGVIIAHDITCFLYDIWIMHFYWSSDNYQTNSLLLKTVIYTEIILILMGVRAALSFIYFFRKSDKKVFPVLIIAISMFICINNLGSIITTIKYAVYESSMGLISNPLALTSLIKLAAGILFSVLVIYQVIILYTKQKPVTDIMVGQEETSPVK
ncbi:MAG: hypothetical protein J5802_11780 [Butyrivibrio sp.]|nr:hypothetical protein [Butyrivibrio sp.]